MNGAPSITKSTAIENSVRTRAIVEYTGFLCATTTTAEPSASRAKIEKISNSIGMDSSRPLQPAGQRHRGDRDQVEDGDREQHLPAEPHELVVAEAREGPAHPDEEEHAGRDLGHQRREAEQHAQPAQPLVVDPGPAPAAEIDRTAQGAAG